MKKHIPNAITCCNLLSGCAATLVACHAPLTGNYTLALLLIVLGAVFDFFDGMTARLLHVSSPIGKELDSLADVVTFGVAPSCMVFACLQQMVNTHHLCPALPFVALLMAAFSALRLAKFNLDTRQTTSFLGLPTPANALFWGALVVGSHDKLLSSPWYTLAVILMVLLFCGLLVSEIPMFSLKFHNLRWADNRLRFSFLVASAASLVIGAVTGGLTGAIAMLPAVIGLYIVLSLLNATR